jgi:hypothetical protein
VTQKVIPVEINEVYKPLSDEVAYLHKKWGIFCQLYASGDDIIDLLNSSAGGFFYECQEIWGADIISNISRLTDPKQMGKGKNTRDNLSLEKLVHAIDSGKFSTLKSNIEKLLDETMNRCSVIRKFRHKRLGHIDFFTRVNARANPLSIPTKKNIEDALESICNVMNAVSKHFHGSDIATVNYTDLVDLPHDAHMLIARLREAKVYRSQRQE